MTRYHLTFARTVGATILSVELARPLSAAEQSIITTQLLKMLAEFRMDVGQILVLNDLDT